MASVDTALRLFIPITKVDCDTRTIYGVATAEAPDRSGEICDYASSKPFFQAWSAEAEKVSGGRSKGNVRAMHNRIAAGKLTAIDFDDEAKTVSVAAKIVDDDEWAKVQEGVYTGFSQGGRYVRRWPDKETGLIRYTADPSEISIVDLPCLPDATFQVVKADGSVEERAFKSMAAGDAAGHDVDFDKRVEAALLKDAALTFEEAAELVRAALVAEAEAGAAKGAGDDRPAGADSERSQEGSADSSADSAGAVEAGSAAEGDTSKVVEVEAAKVTEAAATPTAGRQERAEFLKAIIAGEVSDPVDEPVLIQVFYDGRDFHDTKKPAAKAIAARNAQSAVDAESAEVDKLFADIGQKLGLDADMVKRTFSDAKRSKDAKDGKAEDDGSFPIENQADLKNAIRAYGRSKDKAKTKRHIVARAKALGLTADLPEAWKSVEILDGVMKAIPGLVALAKAARAGVDMAKWAGEEICDSMAALQAVSILMDLLLSEATEDEYEPEQVQALHEAVRQAKTFIAAEVLEENLPDTILGRAIKMVEFGRDVGAALVKRGARNNQFDQARLQSIHDLAKDLGAGCATKASETKDAEIEDLTKRLETAEHERELLTAKFAEYGPLLMRISEKVDVIANQPVTAKAAVRAVPQGGPAGADAGHEQTAKRFQDYLAGLTSDERALEITKLSLGNPRSFFPNSSK